MRFFNEFKAQPKTVENSQLDTSAAIINKIFSVILKRKFLFTCVKNLINIDFTRHDPRRSGEHKVIYKNFFRFFFTNFTIT